MSYCEEISCEWEGLLNSFEQKLDTAAIVTLPKSLVPEGCSSTAAGIELPASYKGEIPQGYHTAELPAGALLYLESEPYEKEEDFCNAIEQVYRAYEGYDPGRFGYAYDFENAPSFTFGADGAGRAPCVSRKKNLNVKKPFALLYGGRFLFVFCPVVIVTTFPAAICHILPMDLCIQNML